MSLFNMAMITLTISAILAIVFGIIIWFITKEDKSDGANKGFGGVMKDLGQVLKGRAPPSK